MEVDSIYDNPFQAKKSRLSILKLVFALGLQLMMTFAAPSPRERQIFERLDGGSVSRAEMFHVNVTHLNDPVLRFKDGDITSSQALPLINFQMVLTSHRNGRKISIYA